MYWNHNQIKSSSLCIDVYWVWHEERLTLKDKNIENFLLPTDAHNVKKHRVIKTF